VHTPSCQRWRSRRDQYRPAGEPIDPSRYEVAAIPDDVTAKRFVCEHHYSGSYPAARERFGLFRADELVGVAVFSVPVRPEVITSCLPGDWHGGLELGRLVLLDDVEANGESWFVARCFEVLKRDGYTGVVSFSDPMPRTTADGRVVMPGHVGTVYQALNAVYVGQRKRDTMHLLPDGTVMAPRSLAKVRKRDRGWRHVEARLVVYGAEPLGDSEPRAWLDEQLPRIGVRKVRHPGNHKYCWAFSRRARRHLPPSQLYPKLGAA
jgi:hypothetical protein